MGRGGKKGGKRNAAAKRQAKPQSSPPGKAKPKVQPFLVAGLSNLGNTCFFNAVMQVLSQSHHFTARLTAHLASPDYTVKLKLPEKEEPCCLEVVDKVGALAVKLDSFLANMKERSGSTLNPRPVFSEICNKAPRFSGYHQQDSQELLRYLLDCLRTEEINRIKRAVLFSFGVKEQNKKKSEKKLSEQDRKDIKGYGYQVLLAHTFVDDVFGGVLNSTIECRQCGDCTTLHETFLDLSLPIPEDSKSMSELPSPTGRFWGRNKRRAARGAGRDEEGGDQGENLPMYSGTKKEPKPLSKHQQKKEKARLAKEAKKAAKFASKKTLSLQEFHKDTANAEPTEEVVKEIDSKDETARDVGACDESNSQLKEDIEIRSETTAAADHSESTVTQLAEEVQALQIVEPQDSHDDNTTTAGVSCGEEGSSEIAQLSPEEQTDMEEQPSTQTVNQDNVDAGIIDASLSEETVVTTEPTPASMEELQVETDSLLACFKRFCALELLTGDNKFACNVCTKRRSEEKLTSAAQQERSITPPLVADEACMEGEDRASCSSPALQDGRSSSLTDACIEATDSATACGSQEEEEEEDAIAAASSKSDGVGEREEQRDDEEDCDVVFSEASKQLLLAKSPPILTLHLKRFLQQGKKLRKNNRHISFPTSFDLSPFCTPPCLQDVSDSQGRLLYSLYGVVEHSGGMQGGHYTAFVRVRDPPLPTPFPTSSDTNKPASSTTTTADATREQPASPSYSEDIHSLSASNREELDKTVASDPTASASSSSKVEATISGSPKQDAASNPTPTSNSSPTSKRHTSSPSPPPTTTTTSEISPTEPEPPAEVAAAAAATAEVAREGSLETPSSIKETKEEEESLCFDLSSLAGGQWYHISDSHVRTATESEVLRCQAYVLFYEKLPLLRHSV